MVTSTTCLFSRINNILGRQFIPLLEFHDSKCAVLALLDEAKVKLDVWNVTYGNEESVAVLLEDWHVSCFRLSLGISGFSELILD